MKVKYVIDKGHDAKSVWEMMRWTDKKDLKEKSKNFNIEIDDLLKIWEAEQYSKVKSLVCKCVSKKYKNTRSKIELAKVEYQKEWNKIGRIFSKKIEKITGRKWDHDVYRVVLSPFHKGISSFGGNVVVRSCFENSSDQLRITAHEVLMSHIWSIIFAKYPESQKEEKTMKYWGINEITTNALLGLEPEINELWSSRTQGFDSYLTNYPQLRKMKLILEKEYLKKSDFNSFLKVAISRFVG